MRDLLILFLLVVGAWPVRAQEERIVSQREGDGLKVERIRFVYKKDKVLKSQDLRNAMRIQEGERFSRRFFKGDLATAIALYQSKGYREAEIVRKTLSVDGKNRLHIFVELDSGERWKVADMEIRGGGPFAVEKLMNLVELRSGDNLNYGKVLEGERALQIFLNRWGYPHASVRNEWVDHPESYSADVIYHVDPGRKMYFGVIDIENDEALHTRRKLVTGYLTFDKGDLYNPEELARSRNALARTDLFRSVFFSTPAVSIEDSLQPIHLRLQERKYIRLGANAFLNIAGGEMEPRIAGSLQHNNWLGRGAQLGLDASWGQPLQGATVYMTERNLLRTGADLVLSVGLTEEWGSTQVFADPDDPLQYELLTTFDSQLEGMLILYELLGNTSDGQVAARQYIDDVVYDYTSIERLWKVSGTLSKLWGQIYQSNFSITWTRALNRPDSNEDIQYSVGDVTVEEDLGGDDLLEEDDFSGDDLFDDDDFFGDDDFFDDDGSSENEDADDAYIDYSEKGSIPVDDTWEEILKERSRSINFSTEFTRDSRDDRISPSRGTFLRLSGLYAIKLGSRSTYVLDGEAEARWYQRLSDHFVLAVAGQVAQTASLRAGRALPQVYWKKYGGEGSLRGVNPDDIVAVGGGRTGLNLRAEMRFQAGAFGLVGFWDRANVWRYTRDIELADLVKGAGMIDGYGVGLRYVVGFPFRFDLAFNDGFDKDNRMRFYFSIGQAF